MSKKPIIIKSKLAPKNFCVNVFGMLWLRDPSWLKERDINHERIHTAQQREMLFVVFYIVYFLEYLFRLVQYRFKSFKAYMNISFEREAYANQNDLDYLGHRHWYSWLKYLRKKS